MDGQPQQPVDAQFKQPVDAQSAQQSQPAQPSHPCDLNTRARKLPAQPHVAPLQVAQPEPVRSPFEDRAPTRKVNIENRSVLERLSGWRLIAFLLVAFANVGLVFAIIKLTILGDGFRLMSVVAFVVASHCVFSLALAGFRLSLAAKLVHASAYGVFCFWAFDSLQVSTAIRLGQADFHWLLLVGFQALVFSLGAQWFQSRIRKESFFRFSYLDLVLVFTALGVLIPLSMAIWPTKADGRLTRYMLFNQAGWFAWFAAFWHSVLNGCLCYLLIHLFTGRKMHWVRQEKQEALTARRLDDANLESESNSSAHANASSSPRISAEKLTPPRAGQPGQRAIADHPRTSNDIRDNLLLIFLIGLTIGFAFVWAIFLNYQDLLMSANFKFDWTPTFSLGWFTVAMTVWISISLLPVFRLGYKR